MSAAAEFRPAQLRLRTSGLQLTAEDLKGSIRLGFLQRHFRCVTRHLCKCTEPRPAEQVTRCGHNIVQQTLRSPSSY